MRQHLCRLEKTHKPTHELPVVERRARSARLLLLMATCRLLTSRMAHKHIHRNRDMPSNNVM
jgi:hypothetical protein